MDINLIGPPSPQQVINAAANSIEKSLVGTNIEVAKYFAPVAAKLLEEGVAGATTPVQVRSSLCDTLYSMYCPRCEEETVYVLATCLAASVTPTHRASKPGAHIHISGLSQILESGSADH